MRQVGHLPELHEDARSEKYIKKMYFSFLILANTFRVEL